MKVGLLERCHSSQCLRLFFIISVFVLFCSNHRSVSPKIMFSILSPNPSRLPASTLELSITMAFSTSIIQSASAPVNEAESSQTGQAPSSSTNQGETAPTNWPGSSTANLSDLSPESPRTIAIFFAEGEGYFVVDDQVFEDGPEQSRRVRSISDGTIYTRKEVKPWKRQYPDQEIRVWREFELIPTIKESVCYPNSIVTYHQYCSGGKLSEYLANPPREGALPWLNGVSENFIWKLFSDLLRIVDFLHNHEQPANFAVASRDILPWSVLIYYPNGPTNPPDFYLSDLV
jgi:hypothetical protein